MGRIQKMFANTLDLGQIWDIHLPSQDVEKICACIFIHISAQLMNDWKIQQTAMCEI